MKNIITLLLTFSVCFAFSQKVKVKKGKVLFDGVPVLKVDTKARNYTYTNLNDDKKIVVTLEVEKISKDESQDWLIIKDPISSQTKKIKMEWFGISMNYKKGIAELLAKNHNIITDDGIDNLDTFFGVKKTATHNAVRRGSASVKDSHDEYKKLHKTYTEKYNPIKGAIVNKLNFAHITLIKKTDNSLEGITYDVLDKQNEKFAKIFSSEKEIIIITFDNRTQQVQLSNDRTITLSEKVFKFLLENNYKDVLDNGIQERMKVKKEELHNKVKNSANIVKNKGYILTEKGKKISGAVTVVFENFVDPSSEIEFDDGNRDANYAIVYYVNDKGEESYKSFPSADVFLTNKDGSSIKYKKFRTQATKTLNSVSTLRGLINRNSKYYKVIYQGNKLTIFQNPLKQDEYGFYKKGNKRSKVLVKSSLRNYNMLKDYLKCKLPEEFKKLNFKEKSDLMKIVEYYKSSCSK